MRARYRRHVHAARYRLPGRKNSTLPRIVRRIAAASLFLVVVIVCSTIGFYFAGNGQATFIDALYMALITISTAGYDEVIPMISTADRIFAGTTAIVGFGALTFLFPSLSMFFLEQDLDHTLWRRRMEKQIRKLSRHYIVCGFGRVGRNTAHELRLTGRQFVAIDLEHATFNEHQEQFPDLLFLDGDASDDAVLQAADIEDAAGVFAVTGDDSRNLMITITARQLNPRIRVIARAHEVRNIGKMRKAGADDVISPDFTGGMRIASAMIRPHVVSFLDEMLHSDHGLRVEEVVIPERFPPTRLSSLRLRCPEYVLLAVRDGSDWTFNPGDDYLLSPEQILIAMASSRGRAEIEAHIREFLD